MRVVPYVGQAEPIRREADDAANMRVVEPYGKADHLESLGRLPVRAEEG